MAFYSIDEAALWSERTQVMPELDGAGGMEGIRIADFILGNPKDDAPVVKILRMAPGYILPRHGHDCYRVEIVLQGSLSVGDRIFTAGGIMFSEPGNLYGQHVAGPDGCTTAEIFSNFEASHGLILEGPEGLENCDLWTRDGAQRVVELVTSQRARADQSSDRAHTQADNRR